MYYNSLERQEQGKKVLLMKYFINVTNQGHANYIALRENCLYSHRPKALLLQKNTGIFTAHIQRLREGNVFSLPASLQVFGLRLKSFLVTINIQTNIASKWI